MSSKNSIKQYVEGGYYHLYNRGANKQLIFFDSSDYSFFLYLLKIYLSRPETVLKEFKNIKSFQIPLIHNYYDDIKVICFCLMPNHFHLVVKQSESHSIAHFMQSLMTKYVMYINGKYNRSGTLFQGIYKGVLISHDSYLLHVTRYVHLNPLDLNSEQLNLGKSWTTYIDYPFSSYQWYLRGVQNEWFDASAVLNFFKRRNIFAKSNVNSYSAFVEKYGSCLPDNLKHLSID